MVYNAKDYGRFLGDIHRRRVSGSVTCSGEDVELGIGVTRVRCKHNEGESPTGHDHTDGEADCKSSVEEAQSVKGRDREAEGKREPLINR